MHTLPARIAAVTASTALLFVLAAGGSILWMTHALDRQAREQSLVQVGLARANLLDQARLINLDYAKWDAAYDAVRAGDAAWIFDNVGSTAYVGEVFQLAVIWGGALGQELGWRSGGGQVPRAGLLPDGLAAAVEDRLATATPGAFEALDFFAWQGGVLFAVSAAHVEPLEDAASIPREDRFAGHLLLGIAVADEVVAEIADSILLTGAEIVREAPADRPSLPLPGIDGAPAAYFAWNLPHPGGDLLWRMLPILSLVMLAAASLSAMGMRLVRRGAEALVASELQASAAARTDALTGLPNRKAFGEALAAPARAGERAILFLDVDGFKGVNDSLGHAAGDEIIARIAERVAAVAGPGALVARIAGDEFVILLDAPDARARIERLSHAVDRAFDAPFEVRGHRLHLQAAIGYAVQDSDSMAGADLVRQADLAMYEGKRLRARAPVAFGALLEQASHNAYMVERSLRSALAERPEELSVAYQPVVGLDGRMSHAEALARWSSAEHGQVPPSQFVAVAEKAGLVIELGRIVLDRVCEDLAAHPALRVSVNVSALQLAAPNFIADLCARLGARGLDPGRVEVELTESVLLRNPTLSAWQLDQLQGEGFSVALDDFGTGYSSIAYLDQLSFNTLKIDRSFVSDVRRSSKRHALLRAMIRMAHDLGLRVVCEGVETPEDLAGLRRLGCDLVQGYLIGRPVGIEELAPRWLATGGPGAAPLGAATARRGRGQETAA